jgi:hypothetical protein
MPSSRIEKPTSYITGDTFYIRYRDKSVVRFEVFTVVTMKNNVWDVLSCGSYKNRHFGGKYLLYHQGLLLLLTVIIIYSSPVLVSLIMGAISSSETSVLTRATRRNISEEGILHREQRFRNWIFTYWGKRRATSTILSPFKGLVTELSSF